MVAKHKGKANIYILIGILLIVSSFSFVLYNIWDEHRASGKVSGALDKLKELQADEIDNTAKEPDEKEIPDYKLSQEMNMPSIFIDGISYVGSLKINALNLELPVIDDWDYDKMKLGPCTYQGSPYKDKFIILAHNYNSHFGSLKKLKIDDTIIFTDMDGNQFKYKVVEKEALKDTQVEEMKTGNWDLTLFTCSLNRTLRITVRCEKLE